MFHVNTTYAFLTPLILQNHILNDNRAYEGGKQKTMGVLCSSQAEGLFLSVAGLNSYFTVLIIPCLGRFIWVKTTTPDTDSILYVPITYELAGVIKQVLKNIKWLRGNRCIYSLGLIFLCFLITSLEAIQTQRQKENSFFFMFQEEHKLAWEKGIHV